MSSKIYLVHKTHNLQSYNEHYVFFSEEEAISKFNELVGDYLTGEEEMYQDEEDCKYWEGEEGNEMIYITSH